VKRLVLVRHGESRWNVERRIQGQQGTGLSDVGAAQATATAAWLAEAYPGAEVASSDLQRCRETVAPIAERLGAEVRHDVALRERDFGDWSGRLLTEVETGDAERWSRWAAGEDVIEEVGGESSAALAGRVTAALGAVLGRLDDDGTAIVVTHGGPVWHGVHAMLALASLSLGGVANASVTELGSTGGPPWLQSWNQVGHLPPRLVTSLRPSVGRTPERSAPPVGR
jgi:broad specificity phosphatase PhoE